VSRKFARGRRAKGECERSGKEMLLKDMVYDGHVPGLRVAPEWWEPRHPQEYLPPVDDPVALRDPAPERNRVPYTLRWPLIDGQFQPIYTPQFGAETGEPGASSSNPATGVEVETETGTVSFAVAFEPNALETQSEVGDVNIILTIDVTGVEITAAVGDQEGAAADQPEQGNEVGTEVGTSDIAATTEPTGAESGTETGTVDIAASATPTGEQFATETGTVNIVVVEAGYGSGAFGEGTWSN
jgi:hypothetical protein